MNINQDYFVHYVEFPKTVRGVTIPLADGSFDIYINSVLSPEEQKAAFDHELRHISRGHFYNEKPVRENEAEANRTEEKKELRIMAKVPLLSKLSFDHGSFIPAFAGEVELSVPSGNASYMAFELPDNSMEPHFKKGELILLRQASFLCDGDRALFWAKDRPLFRTVQKKGNQMLLLPENRHYTAHYFSDSRAVRLFAVAESL